MAKEKVTPESASSTVDAKKPKVAKPKALEVDAPLISSEVDSTVVPSRMRGSYLTVDPRMDASDITVRFSAKEAPELILEDIVDSSDEAGARRIAIPLDYLTRLMGFTALISYTGKAQGQAAASLVKEVGITFYPASESEELAPHLLHEKIVHNTPTYDMHDHTGDETVLVPVPPLAKAGDKLYCTAATEQDAPRHVFYTVVSGYELTEEDAAPGTILRFSIRRGWLARRKPWRSLTLQCGWITSGLPAEPPADVPAHLETQLPRNALEIQHRRTAALIVAPGLDLPPPHLRQSAEYEGEWWLNPELTKEGGDVNAPIPDTYAGDHVCFFVSGPGVGQKPLGCVTIQNNGDLPSVELSACIVACLFNKSMKLTYTVQFPNSEEPQQSPERLVNVLVPQFTRPNIEEATAGTLDLRTFQGDSMGTVPVWAYAECSSCCWMWVTGEREDGSAYRFDILMDAPVTEHWKTHGVDTTILRQDLQKLADCSNFKLHFSVSFCEACDVADAYEFPAQDFTIVQEDLVLIAPKVCEAVGNQLTIYNGRDGVTVRVKYPSINEHQKISVCWKRTDGTCLPLASKPGNRAVGHVDFHIPREAVIEAAGKTVTINYTVTSACKLATSEDLELHISVPVRLPTPVVPQATPPATQGGILDLRTFSGDASITVEKWWFILEGQRGWLECQGTQEDGFPYVIKVMINEPITASDVADGLSRVLKRDELEKLRNRTPLVVVFKCTTEIGGHAGNAIIFPMLDLIFTKPFEDISNFDDNADLNGWARGPAATDPRDLVFYKESDGNGCLFNYTYTDISNGVLLFKTITGFEVGRRYSFSIEVKRFNLAGAAPRFSLRVNEHPITEQTEFPTTVWVRLVGTFTATASSMTLDIASHVLSGVGNDYLLDKIYVKEV